LRKLSFLTYFCIRIQNLIDMRVQVGDKVRFLNEEGGGIVARIEGTLVFVEDEDGFEIPTTQSQVVVVEEHAAQKTQELQRKTEERKNELQPVEEEPDFSFSPDAADENNPRFAIAFTQDGQSGFVRLHAINDSNLYAFFTIMQQVDSENVTLVAHGTLEPNTQIELKRLDPRSLDGRKWTIQLLLFRRSGVFVPQPPFCEEIIMRSARLVREGSYQTNDYTDDRAIVIPIIKDEFVIKMEQLQQVSKNDLAQAKPAATPKPLSKSSKPKNDTLEVDLHINELLETTAGMSNGEMLEVQLDTFRRTMDANANNHGRRIVFIHGVGNGRLKTELRRELDHKYKQHTYQDASFREYGYGATLVIIK